MGPGCLPAVKPHGRARPKTGTQPVGCCRGVLGAWHQGGQYPGKTLDIEKLGIPDHRGGKVTKPNIEPAVADSRGLRLGRDPVGFVGSVDPFSPMGVSIPGKLPFSRYRGEGSQAVGPGCLPAVKPHGRARPKTGTQPVGCCRGVLGAWHQGRSVSRENPRYREIGDTGP